MDKPFSLEESENIQEVIDGLIIEVRQLHRIIKEKNITIEKLEKIISNFT